ncbi:helix-turn-helix domain-containing protein [Rhodobacteraceae bacterium Araon29]
MSSSQRMPTNIRPLLILEALGESSSPMTPTEIGRAIGLPKQTVHRVCATLVDQGFLIYEDSGKRLRAARRSRTIGAGLMYSSHLHVIRRRILESVARQVGETVNFAVPEVSGMSYLDRVETDWAFRVQLPIGTNVPFHCTASGKTYLASLSANDRAKLIPTLNLEAHTSNTFTSPSALLQELDSISKQGYALDNEEFLDDMLAIAVPVRQASGRFVAAIAFHGPSIRLDREKLVASKPVLLEAARQLQAVLFKD